MTLDDFLVSLVWIVISLLSAGTAVLVVFLIIRLLAQFDILWTVVQEGRAKVILQNEQFWRAVVSKRGHEFRVNIEPDWRENLEQQIRGTTNRRRIVALEQELDDKSDWDIIPIPRGSFESLGRLKRLIGGLHWVGLPPWRRIHSQRLFWTSLEKKGDGTSPEGDGTSPEGDGGGKMVDHFHTTEGTFPYVLVQDDVYVFSLVEVETTELMQVDLTMLLTAKVVNPRRSLFEVEKWLEATINLYSGRIREYIGTKKFADLVRKTSKTRDPKILSEQLAEEMVETSSFVRRHYGVETIKLQVYSINPSDPELVKAVASEYKAEREGQGAIKKAAAEAKATIARAKADAEAIKLKATEEAARYRALGKALSGDGPGDLKADANVAAAVVQTQVEMENLRGSGVTTYVRGPASTMVST